MGTRLDVPFLRFPEGADLSRIPLAALAGLPALTVDASPSPRGALIELDRNAVQDHAVLIRTGWDRRWATERYWEPGPYLASSTVEILLRGGAALVGVDFCSIDDLSDPSRPAEARLLRAGVLVVEHLCNLWTLPPADFRFFAVPPRIVRGKSFPVRAFAELS
jgi:arylformamidase